MGARALLGLPIGVAIVVVLVAVTRCLPEPGNDIEWVQRPESIVVQMKTIDPPGAGGRSDVMIQRIAVPEFTLYGDGTMITRDEARQRLIRAQVPNGKIQSLLNWVRDEGFFNFNSDQPSPTVTDGATTQIYVSTKLAANAVKAYALDADVDQAQQWNQFRHLQRISDRLLQLAAEAQTGGATNYTSTGLVLVVQMIPSGPGGAVPGSWPFADIDLSSISPSDFDIGQRAIAGDQVAGIEQALGHEGGSFLQNGTMYYVGSRPALPYEENFPEFEPISP